MRRICRIEDIQGMEGCPNGFVAVLEKRFYELMEMYQGSEETFTLEPYGEIVLVEKYEEIRDLIFGSKSERNGRRENISVLVCPQ